MPSDTPNTRPNGMPAWLLASAGLLFVLSGAASLAYEVAWVKILSLQFGSSAWSISTVIASFMAGLGAGSAWAGRRADRIRHPLRVYALLELGIAAFGIVSVPILQSMGTPLGALYGPLEDHFGVFVLAQFLLAFVVLFVPTFMMGASLPVLVVGLAAEKGFGQRVALLYGINTLGAALGAIGAGMFMLPAFGISGTVAGAAGLGVAVTIGALLLDRRTTRDVDAIAAAAPARPAGVQPPRLLLAAALIAGFLGIFYQIAWTRLLIPVVGSSTYAFTIILTTFLVGIGLGGLLAALPLLQRASYAKSVGVAMAVTSISAWVGLLLVNELPTLFRAMVQDITSSHLLFLSQGALAGSMILLPTIGMGALLPLAIAGWQARTHSSGRAVGGIYAANTVGSILGSVVAGFIFLSWLGADGSIRLAAVAGLMVAAILLLSERSPARGPRPAWSRGVIVLLAGLLLTSANVDMSELHRGVFRTSQIATGERFQAGSVQVHVREGRNATVTVDRSPQGTVLRVSGKPDASTSGDLRSQYLVGHLPMALHEQPRDVCIVGYGSGATVHAVATHPTVMSVDVVELEPAVMGASDFFATVNHDVLDDPRVRAYVEDGRSFLQYSEGQYDVIISEPSNPWIAGISALFTSEYYQQARTRMKPDGLFCQWIQSYEISRETLEVVLSTLADEFPHIAVFAVDADLVCVASDEPITTDLARLEQRLAVPAVLSSLEQIGLDDPFDLFGILLRTYPEDTDLFDSPLRNTDDNLWLEYRAPIEMYLGVKMTLDWLPAARYLSALQGLFPGMDRLEIARRAAASFVKVVPQVITPPLGEYIGQLSEAVGGDAELDRLAARARHLRNEIAANVGRVESVRALYEAERWSECIATMELVLESEPRRGAVHRLLGSCHVRTNNLEAGEARYLRALELQPDDYEACMNLGWTRIAMGKGDTEGHLDQAITLNPQYFEAWGTLVNQLLNTGEFDAVRARLRDAERSLPPDDYKRLLDGAVPILTRAGR